MMTDPQTIRRIANDPAVRKDVLNRINRVRELTGSPTLAELPQAVPQDGCQCVFGRGLPDIGVAYDGLPDTGREWQPGDPVTGIAVFDVHAYNGPLLEQIADALGGRLDQAGAFVYVDLADPTMQFMWAFDHWLCPDLVDTEDAVDEPPAYAAAAYDDETDQ